MAPGTKQERVIGGRYTLLERLGSGGMGVVWKAHDQLLMREVAIKEVSIPHEVPAEERSGLYTRAIREARAAARLGHPNTVTVFDVHEEDERPYIVMEFVRGETLQQVVQDRGPLDPPEASRLGLAVLDALKRAHKAGIVHRDVKPGNIMVSEEGPVKLADFGIAAVKDDPRITQTGVVLGSPSYLAPEQARGEPATPETDLWSLGASLYYAVEGEAPFDRGNAVATVDAVVHESPRASRRAGALEAALDRLLEKDPGRRPSYDEARRLLETGAGAGSGVGSGTQRRTTAPLPAPSPAPERASTPTETEEAHTGRGNRRGRLVAAGLVAGAVAVALLLWASPWDEVRDPGRSDAREAEEGPGDGGDGGDGEGSGGGVPADWTTYEDDEAGYRIKHPTDWEIVPDRGASSNTDFIDPETGAYLRVAWRSPPDPAGAVGAWEEYEPAFASDKAGYQRVGPIEEYSYRDYDAAWWEYTYGNVHAVNLGFVVEDEYGFALNLQTPADLWDDYQDDFEAFQRSFRPPE